MSLTPHPWPSVVMPIKDERDNLAPLTKQMITVLSAHVESTMVLCPRSCRSRHAR